MCSNGCPVAYAMDYHPNEIIYMIRLGLKDKVLQSKAMWVCISCETCATRCPNEIEIVHLMDILRRQSLQEKTKSSTAKAPQFHKSFINGIRKRGRVDTVELLLNYELKTLDVFSSFKKIIEQSSQALEMLRKGKFKLPFRKKHGQKKTEALFNKVLTDN
jgi:heterodisulfide reductase subunit C